MNKISRIKYQVLGMLVVGLVAAVPAQALSLKGVDVKMRREYAEKKAKYVRTRDTYKDAKTDYLRVRDDLKRYRAGELKNLSLERAKEYFIKVGEGMIKYLDLIKRKVEEAKGLSEEQRSNLVAEIDKDITWLKGKQDEVQGAENREELRVLAKEVRDYWREVRRKVRGIVGRMMGYRVGHVIERMEKVGEKVRAMIDKLAEKGEDVTALEKWYAVYEEHLAKAKEGYETAKAKYGEIESVAEGDKLLRAGNAYMKEVNVHLREAHKALKEIVVGMREMK